MAQQVLTKMEEQMVPEGKWEISRRRHYLGMWGVGAFAVAFVVSIVSGFVARDNAGISLALVILGLIASLMNAKTRDAVPILVTSIALIVGAGAGVFTTLDGLIAGLGSGLNGAVTYFATFMVPAAIVTAVRYVYNLSRVGPRRA